MTAFEVQKAYQLASLPEEQHWLIENLWSHQAVGIIGGEPKSYKSFLALSMAVAITSGQPCLGRYPVLEPGRVLLFAAEDAPHIVRERLEGICAHFRVDFAALDLWVITTPVIRLDQEKDRLRLRQTVKQLQPRLLILDPLVRLHNVDENVASAIVPMLAFLRGLQRQFACAVALVHHARKGGNALRAGQALRGSSEIHAWGDSNLYLRRQKGQIALTIEHRAQPSYDGIPLTLKTDAASVSLVTAEENNANCKPQLDITKHASDKNRILDTLRSFHRPVRQRILREVCRIRAESLTHLLRNLVAEGDVIRTKDGWVLAAHQDCLSLEYQSDGM
jgi:hypothetical protein